MKTEKQINFDVQSAELNELEEEWLNINWNKVKRGVFKIQQRIYRAEANDVLQITNTLEPTCLETNTSGSEERKSEQSL